jgi:sigma-E factor negative regulatory protein RseC
MIEQQAQVTFVKGDKVWMTVKRQSGCQHCSLSEGCGTGSLGKLMGYKSTEWVFPNTLGLKSGDTVMLTIPDKSYLLSSFLIYLLPLLTFFLSAVIAEYLWHAEWVTVVISLLGLSTGLLFSASLSRRRYANALQPKIMRKIC